MFGTLLGGLGSGMGSALLGGLLGGASGGGDNTQTVVNDVPPWLKGYLTGGKDRYGGPAFQRPPISGDWMHWMNNAQAGHLLGPAPPMTANDMRYTGRNVYDAPFTMYPARPNISTMPENYGMPRHGGYMQMIPYAGTGGGQGMVGSAGKNPMTTTPNYPNPGNYGGFDWYTAPYPSQTPRPPAGVNPATPPAASTPNPQDNLALARQLMSMNKLMSQNLGQGMPLINSLDAMAWANANPEADPRQLHRAARDPINAIRRL